MGMYLRGFYMIKGLMRRVAIHVFQNYSWKLMLVEGMWILLLQFFTKLTLMMLLVAEDCWEVIKIVFDRSWKKATT